MVVESFPDFLQWLFTGPVDNDGMVTGPGAFFKFLFLVFSASFLGIFFGYLVAAFRHGPQEAFYVVAKVVAGAFPDWFKTSPRRVSAIGRLAAKEALRRRVILVAFAIFAIALLFGGWFINSGSDHPERVYINFVMWGTQLLILMMVMLISAFSLPEDIKNRTIYTVATKPVRTSEIVLGRILGFAGLGTLLLLLMGIISLLFVWRGLAHDHQVSVNENEQVEFTQVDPTNTGHRASQNAISESLTTSTSGHAHYVEVIEDIRDKDSPKPKNMEGVIETVERGDKMVYKRLQVTHAGGHTHKITAQGSLSDDVDDYRLSSARGFFRARVPDYAERLVFFDRVGSPKRTGISVGDQWAYRGYIDGGVTLSKAEYYFEDFSPDNFGDLETLPLELTLGVFRSTKGDIVSRIRVGLQFESVQQEGEAPGNKFQSEELEFETREFEVQVKGIPRRLPGQVLGPDGELLETGYYDLFDHFAKNGVLKLNVRCKDSGQYLGMAQADVYFRATDQAYWWNFAKGYFGIWMQMMIVISLGVAFSTFLSAPVTMLATICTIVFGFFSASIRGLMIGDVVGGGPLESFVRLVTQKNLDQPLPETLGISVIQKIDSVFIGIVGSITNIVPNFSRMDFSDFLTYGYFVDMDRILVALSLTLAFCFGLLIFGYFCLKTRELAG